MTATSGTSSTTGTAVARWLRRFGWRHLIAVLAVCFALFPLLFVLSAALNPLGTLQSSTLLPRHASLANFTALFTDGQYPFARWLGNTALVCGTFAVLNVLLGVLAAYAFSRFRFRGRRFGLMAVFLVQMFPQFLAVVSLYLMFAKIGDVLPAIGLDTPWGLVLVYLGGAMGVNTWLMKGYLDTIPREIDEAAKVDGAGHAQIFFRLILPLAAPMLVVISILSLTAALNDVILANIFLTSNDSKTVAVGLYGIISGQQDQNYGLFAAGALVTSLPVIVAYQFLQRYLAQGLTAGSVKG
ncbi:sugar ABC transporter permease [Kitasatospora sp. NPDC057512]|uniref:sugar ABC transporter permease n=1 Tax=Kitasatospora sp. NPDC057512 TaxID=3346154 RepID=UPI0036B3D3CF